jgi:hypothetical protein
MNHVFCDTQSYGPTYEADTYFEAASSLEAASSCDEQQIAMVSLFTIYYVQSLSDVKTVQIVCTLIAQ